MAAIIAAIDVTTFTALLFANLTRLLMGVRIATTVAVGRGYRRRCVGRDGQAWCPDL